MDLKKLVTKETVSLEVRGETKQEIIENLLDILCRTGKVKDRRKALESILARESKMSTGLKNGIAIPHGKTDAVDELLACIALRREGVEFASLDGLPARIFIMTLSSIDRTGPHLEFLAEVIRLLEDDREREALLESRTPEDIITAFTGKNSR